MATFSIKDLLLGQKNDETVAERLDDKIRRREKTSVGEKPYQEHRSRQETEELIKNYLAQQGKPMTVSPIARAIGRAVSPHFRRVLAGMVQTGQIVETVDTVPNGAMARYWYSLPEKK